jgi:hypothetical protein
MPRASLDSPVGSRLTAAPQITGRAAGTSSVRMSRVTGKQWGDEMPHRPRVGSARSPRADSGPSPGRRTRARQQDARPPCPRRRPPPCGSEVAQPDPAPPDLALAAVIQPAAPGRALPQRTGPLPAAGSRDAGGSDRMVQLDGGAPRASARWRSSGEAAGDAAAVRVVERDEFAGDEPRGLVDLLGGGRGVLVDEQPSQLPQAFKALCACEPITPIRWRARRSRRALSASSRVRTSASSRPRAARSAM